MRGSLVTKPIAGARIDQGHPLARNLIGAWGFLDAVGLVFKDLSWLRNDGVIGSAPTWNPTEFGSALQMTTASTSKVAVTYQTQYNCLNGVSISVRVKTPSSFTNTFRSIFGKPFASTHTSPFFDWSVGMPFTDSTHVQVEFRVGSTVGDTGATTFGVSTWVHIIATQQSNGDMALHVNNVLNITTASGAALPTNTNSQDLKFGINAGNSENFEGIIEHAFLWDRGLSTSEVLELFKNPYAPLGVGNNFIGLVDQFGSGVTVAVNQPLWIPEHPDVFRGKRILEFPSASQPPIGDVVPVADVSWIQRQDNPVKQARRIVHGEMAGPQVTATAASGVAFLPADSQIARPLRRADQGGYVEPPPFELDAPSRLTWLPVDPEARRARRPMDQSVAVEPSPGELNVSSRLIWLPVDPEARRDKRRAELFAFAEPMAELDSPSRLLWLPVDPEARKDKRRAELFVFVEPTSELDSPSRLTWLPEMQEARRGLRRIGFGPELAEGPAFELDSPSRLLWLPVDPEARKGKRTAELSGFVEPISELDAARRLTWLPVWPEFRPDARRENRGSVVAPAIVVAEPGISWFPNFDAWHRFKRTAELGGMFAPTAQAVVVPTLPWLQVVEPLPTRPVRRLDPSVFVAPRPAEVFSALPWVPVAPEWFGRRARALGEAVIPPFAVSTDLPWLPVLPDGARRARPVAVDALALAPFAGLAGVPWLPTYPDALRRARQAAPEAFAAPFTVDTSLGWLAVYPDAFRRPRYAAPDAPTLPLAVMGALGWLSAYPDALRRSRALPEGFQVAPVAQVPTTLPWLPQAAEWMRRSSRLAQLGVPVGWIEPPAQLPAGQVLFWLPEAPTHFFRVHPVAGLPVGFLLTPESFFVRARPNTSSSVVGTSKPAGLSGLDDAKKSGTGR